MIDIDKGADCNFNCLVQGFGLSIGLQVRCSG